MKEHNSHHSKALLQPQRSFVPHVLPSSGSVADVAVASPPPAVVHVVVVEVLVVEVVVVRRWDHRHRQDVLG